MDADRQVAQQQEQDRQVQDALAGQIQELVRRRKLWELMQSMGQVSPGLMRPGSELQDPFSVLTPPTDRGYIPNDPRVQKPLRELPSGVKG